MGDGTMALLSWRIGPGGHGHQTCCEKQQDSSTPNRCSLTAGFEPVPFTGTHTFKGMGLHLGPQLNANMHLSWHPATQTLPSTLLCPHPAQAPPFWGNIVSPASNQSCKKPQVFVSANPTLFVSITKVMGELRWPE